ncbi:MAG: CoA pyrophosphatase [Dehalococcoidia bacterium]|nr:CoA pyrophosphatase [Dehalococcoidia bacterium]
MERSRIVLAGYTPRLLTLEPGQRSSAVMVPLLLDGGGYRVVLTKRTDHVEHHKGEISFPGGAHDPEDAGLRETALREMEEEIGVLREHVEVVGQLDDVVTGANYRIRPYVGVVDRSPYPFERNREEVAEVLAVPFSHLLDPAYVRDEEVVRFNGMRMRMRSYVWNEHVIWGATALILRGLIDLLEQGGALTELSGRQ